MKFGYYHQCQGYRVNLCLHSFPHGLLPEPATMCPFLQSDSTFPFSLCSQ